MAGGEHGDRGAHGLGGDSTAEGSEGAGDSGVSAEQGGDVVRVLSGSAATAQVEKIAARAASFDAVEPQVRKIVDDVRSDGDNALRKYAEQWDGLKKGASL